MRENSADPLRLARGLYYAAKFVAQSSQNLWLATLFIVAGTGDSPALDLSSLFLATLLPSVILGLPGGALADRLGPARGYATGAGLRFAAVGAAVLLLQGGTTAWLLAFLYSTASQLFTPAEMALVRPLQKRRSGGVHSWLVALQYAGQVTGMLIAAPVLYLLGGFTLMLWGAAAGFLVLTVVTLVLASQLGGLETETPRKVAAAMRFGETCRFFGREHLARYAVVALALKMVVAKAIVVTLPFYLERDLGLGLGAVAYLAVPGIAGVLAGLVWSGRTLTLDGAHEAMRLSLAGLAVALGALAALDYGIRAVAEQSHVPPVVHLEATMNTTFVVAMPVALVLGWSLSRALVAARVALTELAPVGQQARVFAVQLTLTDSLIALPLLAMGIGTTFAGARMTLGSIGILVLFAVALLEFDRIRGSSRGRAGLPGEPLAATGAEVPVISQA